MIAAITNPAKADSCIKTKSVTSTMILVDLAAEPHSLIACARIPQECVSSLALPLPPPFLALRFQTVGVDQSY